MSTETPSDINELVQFCLAEDIGSGDITAELIPPGKTLSAKIISKDSGILCGIPWVEEVFRQVDASVKLDWLITEGSDLTHGAVIVRISGPARGILTAERTALNFLQTLSATATISKNFAAIVSHTNVQILDTRKTLPGLRSAQKYAVAVGGCSNHRMGLYDAFLIKENHIAACGGIERAIDKARTLYPKKPIEVEVRTLSELEEAVSARADTVMLDNFSLEDIATAIELTGNRSMLEASGGIEQDGLATIAESGVDYISIGALTKNCQALDLSLLIE